MKELSRYFREVGRALPCGGEKKKILRDLRRSIEGFLEENPAATYDEVVNRFGTPEQISDSYVEEMPPQEVQKKLKVRKWIIGIVAGAAACALLVWGITLGIALINETNRDSGLLIVEQPVEEIGNENAEMGG